VNRYDLNMISAPSAGGSLSPDRYEWNDSPQTCAPVSIDYDTGGIPLNIHDAADVDYFCFHLLGSGNRTVTVDLLYKAADGNLDVELIYMKTPSDLRLIARGDTATDDEHISAVLSAGLSHEYLVRVYGFNGAINEYELAITAVSGGGLTPDVWEPNDFFLNPHPQFLDMDMGGPVFENLNIHNSIDEDWISFSVTRPGTVTIHLSFQVDWIANPVNGNDLDMALWDDQRSLLVVASAKDDDELLTFDVQAAVEYRIQIWGHKGATNTYLFSLDCQ
jgi:hypothetical protein